jgi:hypothetical protein
LGIPLPKPIGEDCFGIPLPKPITEIACNQDCSPKNCCGAPLCISDYFDTNRLKISPIDCPKCEIPKIEIECPKCDTKQPICEIPKFKVECPKCEVPKIEFECPKYEIPKIECTIPKTSCDQSKCEKKPKITKDCPKPKKQKSQAPKCSPQTFTSYNPY